MPSEAKEMLMKEVEKEFKAPYAFFSSFDKIGVADLSEFRKSTSKVAKRSLVVKHTFAKKILEKRSLGGFEQLLKGQVVVTFGEAEPQNISKAIVDFMKTNDKMVPAGMIFEDKIYGQDFVKQLAKMPSRHELLTQVVVRVKSPISGFVMTLGAITRGLVVALNEIKKQKEATGTI